MSAKDFVKKSYDYVIIGGGTAGLVLAARLTEDPNVSVGVLEAGPNHMGDPLVDAPNAFTQLWDKPQYDWSFKTKPQKGTAGKVHGWARGKALGGSSAVNLNMFSMASRKDLDNWQELGNPGWGWDNLAPYYKKMETYSPPSQAVSEKMNSKYVDSLLRGTDGPLQVSFCEADFMWQQDVWPKLCLEAGYPVPKDPRTGTAIGGFNQLTTVDPKTAKRSYSASAYYEPNKDRSNLSVLTEALVSKIDLEKGAENMTATGVQFTSNGNSYTVKAKKEVIVAGGAINSPQILELSGIGSRSVLEKVGIEVIVENAGVGENLNDHSATAISLGVKDEYPTGEVLARNPEIAQQAMAAYIEHKAGPFTNAPTCSGFASLQLLDPDLKELENYIKSVVTEYQKANPESDPAGRDQLLAKSLADPNEAAMQVILLGVGVNTANVHAASQLFVHDAPGNWITLACCSSRSFSRGSVHIESTDPTTHPAIDPAYYSHPLDLDVAARGLLHLLSLAQLEPLHSKLRKDEDGNLILHPSTVGGWPKTLEEAKVTVQNSTVTEYHPIGTCAMLPKEKGGVVDSHCKVYGTSNVRVVDASVFPLHVQGNVVSLVYAVAEKAADIIKGVP